MGGDNAPDAILKGALSAIKLLSEGDTLVLVGDQEIITEALEEEGVCNDPHIEIVATTQVIGMGDLPISTLREKPDSSIVKWGWLGSPRSKDERCDVIISAGNTGACVAAAQMSMRRLPGVHRPGIAVTIPKEDARSAIFVVRDPRQRLGTDDRDGFVVTRADQRLGMV